MTDLIRVKATWTDGTEWTRDFHDYILPDELGNVWRSVSAYHPGNVPPSTFVVGSPEEVERMTATSSLGPDLPEKYSDEVYDFVCRVNNILPLRRL